MGVKMKKTNLEFLSLLKSSLKNEKYDGEKIDFEDLVYIYKMSEIHHVVPMVYNAAYNEDFFKECDANFQAMFKSSAFRYIFSQIQRTNHFLEVYKKLSKKI